jgi:D-alanine-D-alanine ligase-like ATP-grasp enzyme
MKIDLKKFWPGANSRSARRTADVNVTLDRDEYAHISQYGKRYISELVALLPCEKRKEVLGSEDPTFHNAAEFLGELMILLQRTMGYPVGELSYSHYNTMEPCTEGATAHIEFAHENAFLEALKFVAKAIKQGGQLKGSSYQNDFARTLYALAGDELSEPSGEACYINAALTLGIPYAQTVILPSFLAFGQGVNRRQSWRNMSDSTGHIATVTSTNKIIANRLMARAGLPVPRQLVVRQTQEAVNALKKLGAPVVVKPHNQDYGTAVFPQLEKETEVRQAFKVASRYGAVIVEKHIKGDNHRIMVINGRYISARQQRPAHIVATGRDTIAEIHSNANQARLAKGWKAIPADAEATDLIVRQGFDWSSVPDAGHTIYFRRQANLSTGGSMEICTDRVHPENKLMAERAAEVLGIDIAGIDFISPDISQSFLDGVGAICEVNVNPGFIFDENKLLLNEWFPNGDNGRIPVIGVLGECKEDHLEVCLAEALGQQTDGKIALTVNGNIFLDGLRIARAEAKKPPERVIFLGTDASAAVLALSPEEYTKRGVELDRLDLLLLRSPLQPAAAAAAEIAKRIAKVTISAEHVTGTTLNMTCPVCGNAISEQDRSLLIKALSSLQEIIPLGKGR